MGIDTSVGLFVIQRHNLPDIFPDHRAGFYRVIRENRRCGTVPHLGTDCAADFEAGNGDNRDVCGIRLLE